MTDDDSTDKPVGPRTVRSVTHAVSLLKAIAQSSGGHTLGDLADVVGLSKPATFNLLKTLEVEGLVHKENARYELGWGVYELGTAVARSTDITRVARAPLDRLAEETGEAALLAIYDDDTVLYLDRGQAHSTFTMVANVGRRSPLHTNASGKVLLAGQTDTVIDRVLAAPLVASTPLTHSDPGQLRRELRDVRTQGYALCVEEQEIGLSSISVPILDRSHSVHAALTIAGPSQRIDGASKDLLLDLLRAEAREISARLGATLTEAFGSG